MDTDEFAQATQLEQSFSVPYSGASQLVTEILLSVIGSIGTIIGVLMPLGAVGGITEATISKSDAETVVAHGSGPLAKPAGIPRSPGQPAVQQAAPVNGESTDNEPPPGDDPTMPNPKCPSCGGGVCATCGGALGGDGGSGDGGSGDGGTGDGGSGDGGNGDGDQTITVTTGQGTGIKGKIGNTQFLGNAAFIAPASLVNLGNTIWADIRPQP